MEIRGLSQSDGRVDNSAQINSLIRQKEYLQKEIMRIKKDSFISDKEKLEKIEIITMHITNIEIEIRRLKRNDKGLNRISEKPPKSMDKADQSVENTKTVEKAELKMDGLFDALL